VKRRDRNLMVNATLLMLKLGIVDTIVDIISIPFPPLIVVFTKSHNGTCK